MELWLVPEPRETWNSRGGFPSRVRVLEEALTARDAAQKWEGARKDYVPLLSCPLLPVLGGLGEEDGIEGAKEDTPAQE